MKITPSWLQNSAVQKLMKVLESRGKSYRFVGGCVRDALLGLESHDIDIAVPYTPAETLALLKQANIEAVPTGLAFGTVTAIIDGKAFEITSLRKDIETDGRHAVVHYTQSYEDDAQRRDFTMNALFMDKNGEITDYVNGFTDLKAGHVRFVGDPLARMMEDHLRMLRLFRFWARYGKVPLDSPTLEACAKIAPLLPKLSMERVCKELLKTLEAKRAPEVFALIFERGFLKPLFPFLHTAHLLKRLIDLGYKGSVNLALCCLATTLEFSETLAKTLRMPKKDQTFIGCLWRAAHVLRGQHKGAVLKLQEEEGVSFTKEALMLLAVKYPECANFTSLHLKALPYAFQPFPLTGDDFLKAGFKNQALGQALLEAKEWWYNHEGQKTREECLTFLETLKEA